MHINNCILEIDGYSLQKIHEKDKFFGIYDFKVANSSFYAILQDRSPSSQVELAIVRPQDQDEDVIDFKLLGLEQSASLLSA